MEVVKLKDNKLLDTSSSSYRRKDLSTIIYNLQETPIGEFVLWEGNKLISNNNSFQFIGTRYQALGDLRQIFPEKAGYTRSYKLKLEYTDNKSSGGVYITLRDNNDSNSTDFIFGKTWGGTDDGVRRSDVLNFPNSNWSKFPSWIKIYGTPDFATGGSIRYYKLSLLIYDKIIV